MHGRRFRNCRNADTDQRRSRIPANNARDAASRSRLQVDKVGAETAGAVGGPRTVKVAEAAAPGGASDEVTVDVVFNQTPTAVPFTLTVIVHDWPAARTEDVLEKVSVPGLIENMPPPVAGVLQVPPVCVIRSICAGIVSLNCTFVSGT